MKDKRFTEFTIMIDKTPLGEALLIQTNERNEAYIDDDEIEALIFSLEIFRKVRSSRPTPPSSRRGGGEGVNDEQTHYQATFRSQRTNHLS